MIQPPAATNAMDQRTATLRFDVVAGLTKRAPKWMQNTGLEWFYRFLQEPRRMFRRYFIEDMYFFWLLIKEVFSRPSSSQTEAGQ